MTRVPRLYIKQIYFICQRTHQYGTLSNIICVFFFRTQDVETRFYSKRSGTSITLRT